MNNSFWTNTIWYVLLSIITLSMFILSLVKSKNRSLTIVGYFAVLGITCYIEAGIMFLFHSYEYYPAVASSPALENLAGNYFSQTSISATVILITVLELPFYWSLIAAGIYYAIEELFIKLGIYSHIWYRTWMTTVGLIFLFWLIKKVYTKLKYSKSKLLHNVTLFFSVFGLYSITVYRLISVSGFVHFNKLGINYSLNPIFLNDPYYKNGWGFFLYCIPHIIIMIILVHIKLHRVLKIAGLLALYFEHYLLFRFSILAMNGSLFLILSSILILSMYIMTNVFNKLLEMGKVNIHTAV